MRQVLVGVGVMAAAAVVGMGLRPVAAQDAANKSAFYTEKVKPILEENCYKCHGGMNHRGGLNFQTKAGMMKGGRDGAVVVPDDPAASLLVKLMRHEGPPNDPRPMPPRGPKLSDADIAIVTQWVKAGAVMPDDPPMSQSAN